jgi:hypothetical protein
MSDQMERRRLREEVWRRLDAKVETGEFSRLAEAYGWLKEKMNEKRSPFIGKLDVDGLRKAIGILA